MRGASMVSHSLGKNAHSAADTHHRRMLQRYGDVPTFTNTVRLSRTRSDCCRRGDLELLFAE